MLGYVVYRETGAPTPPLCVLDGVRFRVAYVVRGTGALARFSARSAARQLRRGSVRCAVFPPEYPYIEIFAAHGIGAPPLTPLYHATAAALTRRYMAQCGVEVQSATLAFSARELSPELRRAVRELSGEARHIVLDVPGAERFAYALRRECGVAARIAVPDEPPAADLTVCFDPCAAEGEMLPLYAPDLSVRYDSEHPNELLAAFLHAGALDAAGLGVRSVEKME